MTKSHLAIFLILGYVTTTFSEEKRPNIIFIMADDLGRNDSSFYGDHKNGVETPNIDRIFRSGIAFQNFHANSPVCSPTRAALMTGLYPDRAAPGGTGAGGILPGRIARGLRTPGRYFSGLPGFWSPLGPDVAGYGALQRQQWLRLG